jgi:hypothetical protein
MARPDTEYQVTPKGEEMAKRLAQTRGMKGMMGNKASPSSTAEQTDSRILKTPKKDPNYTTISGGVGRPLRQNDTVSDILAKMYNFMRKKYERDLKDAKKEKKYKVSLVKAKENRIEELIKLFKGKYKRKVSKDTKKDKGLFNGVIDKAKQTIQSVKEGAKTILKKSTTAVSKVTPSVSTVAKVAVGGAVVAASTSAIGGAESGGNYDITFGDRVDKKTGKIVNSKGYKTPEDLFGKKLTEMTLAEVKEFGKKRQAASPNSGASGKYQFMPTTLFGYDKNGKHIPGLVDQAGLSMNAKFSPEVQEQLQSILEKQNEASLKKQGVDATMGNKYMAHYIGAPGAVAVNRAKSRGENKTVAQAMIDEGLKAPGRENNTELYEIKVKDFEGILAQRMSKHGASSPHSSAETTKPAPKETKPIPQQIKPPANNSGSLTMLNTNNTNILNGGTNYSVTQDNVKSTAPLLDLQYN